MFSRFFIDRPIFAVVISVFFVIAGLAAMRSLPIAQYPEIAPPVVTVQAVYPGASAEVIESTVAAPLENAINGVPGMIYMSSNSSSNGVAQIQVTFEIGTNIDIAAVNVANRVKQVESRLPLEVRRQGVSVEPGSSAFLQVLAFYSPDGRYDDLFTSNYVTLNVLDRLKRLPGTTNVQIFGAKDYAMRIWLRPDRLAQLKSDPGRRRQRDQRAERPVRGRQGGPDADRQGPGSRLHDHFQGAPCRHRAVRQDHRARERGRFGGAAGRRGPRRTRLAGLRVQRPLQRPPGDAGWHISRAGRERTRCRKERPRHRRRDGATVPRRIRVRSAVRHHPLRQGVDPGSAEDPGRGDAAGLPGRVPVPPELAGGGHTVCRSAGVADRNICRNLRAGLLHQHADAVRHGARDRNCRRRCHRRAGERRADHARGGPSPTRRRGEGDARGHRTHRRDRTHADRGLRTDRVPRRADRRAVSPVRSDHCDLRRAVGHRRADAVAGAVRDHVAARPPRAKPILSLVQRLVHPGHRPLR